MSSSSNKTDPPYELHLTSRAQKDIQKQRAHEARIVWALTALEAEPYRGHALSGSLRGARALTFSVPGSAFRACYVVDDDERSCLVFMVGPRENFYDEAERRYETLRGPGR